MNILRLSYLSKHWPCLGSLLGVVARTRAAAWHLSCLPHVLRPFVFELFPVTFVLHSLVLFYYHAPLDLCLSQGDGGWFTHGAFRGTSLWGLLLWCGGGCRRRLVICCAWATRLVASSLTADTKMCHSLHNCWLAQQMFPIKLSRCSC